MLSIIIPVLSLKRAKNSSRFFMPKSEIKDVLNDIKKNVSVDHEIIIVCNGDDQELKNFIINDNRIDRYCINSQNVGVARAWNMGAELSKGEILCFLNDDVEISKGSFEILLETLNSSDEIAQVGPQGAYWKKCKHVSNVEGKNAQDCDAIAGYCFMMKSEIYYKLGGFDNAFTPAGFEEIDMCYKIRDYGMKCVAVPSSKVKHFHHHGISAKDTDIHFMGESINTKDLNEKNYKIFQDKWLSKLP